MLFSTRAVWNQHVFHEGVLKPSILPRGRIRRQELRGDGERVDPGHREVGGHARRRLPEAQEGPPGGLEEACGMRRRQGQAGQGGPQERAGPIGGGEPARGYKQPRSLQNKTRARLTNNLLVASVLQQVFV